MAQGQSRATSEKVDLSFPVENWYALNGPFPTLSLITYPRAGHAAHFQYPELAAAHIAAFIRDTKKI